MEELIVNSSSYEELYLQLQTLNFSSFKFEVSKEKNKNNLSKSIHFANFCFSLSKKLQEELSSFPVPDTNFSVVNYNLDCNFKLSTYRFDVLSKDMIDQKIKNRTVFFLGWYNNNSFRKKEFISLYNSYRPTNIVEKFSNLSDPNLETKIISEIIKRTNK
jgi:hypothetical protein